MLTCGRADVLGCWRAGVVGMVVGLALFAAGCQSAPDDPEAQIRALIAKAEKAAEEKDLGTLKGLVSETYSGEKQKNKRELVGFIGYFFLRQKSIHLLTQVDTIEFPEPKHAEASVYVGMAARSISGPGDLRSLRADIYRIEFTALDEGNADWKVTRAEWRPAGIDDLDPGGAE